MTIKKIGLSVITASVVLAGAATVANADAKIGTAHVDSNASTIASELLIGQDYNKTNVDLNTTFAPSLNAGVQDGKIMIEFKGGRLESVNSGIVVYNLDTNKTVGNNPTLSGTDKQKLIFDVNDTINDADTLRLTQNDTNGTAARDTNATVVLDVLQGSDTVTMNYSLLDNVDSPLSTADAGTVVKTAQEWEVSVNQKFDAQIDAAQNFKLFTATSNSTTTVDKSDVNIKHNSVKVGTGAVTWNVKTYMENNVSTFGTLAANHGAPSVITDTNGYVVDDNITTAAAASDDYNLTFTANTTNKILETTFSTSVSAVSATKNANFTKSYLNKSNLGAWTVYGYKAQIPGVRGDSEDSPYATTLMFTNRSNLPAKVNFTLIDQNGNVASVVSDQFTESKLQVLDANETCKYNAWELKKLATDKNPNFADTGTFSVEVSIPTTPSKVYGFASYKNKDRNNFKDLPIYNTSKLSY